MVVLGGGYVSYERGTPVGQDHDFRDAAVTYVRLHSRKVDVRLPGKGNSNSHGARPVHLIITMIKWIGTSRLSKKTLSLRLHSRYHF